MRGLWHATATGLSHTWSWCWSAGLSSAHVIRMSSNTLHVEGGCVIEEWLASHTVSVMRVVYTAVHDNRYEAAMQLTDTDGVEMWGCTRHISVWRHLGRVSSKNNLNLTVVDAIRMITRDTIVWFPKQHTDLWPIPLQSVPGVLFSAWPGKRLSSHISVLRHKNARSIYSPCFIKWAHWLMHRLHSLSPGGMRHFLTLWHAS